MAGMIKQSIRSLLPFNLLTGIIWYPLLITGIARVIFSGVRWVLPERKG